MFDQIGESTDRMDAKTVKAVAAAIGQRLRADERPEGARLPSRLQLLLDQLRAQDDNTRGCHP
jgi:hypothetical protein